MASVFIVAEMCGAGVVALPVTLGHAGRPPPLSSSNPIYRYPPRRSPPRPRSLFLRIYRRPTVPELDNYAEEMGRVPGTLPPAIPRDGLPGTGIQGQDRPPPSSGPKLSSGTRWMSAWPSPSTGSRYAEEEKEMKERQQKREKEAKMDRSEEKTRGREKQQQGKRETEPKEDEPDE